MGGAYRHNILIEAVPYGFSVTYADRRDEFSWIGVDALVALLRAIRLAESMALPRYTYVAVGVDAIGSAFPNPHYMRIMDVIDRALQGRSPRRYFTLDDVEAVLALLLAREFDAAEKLFVSMIQARRERAL